MNLSQSFPPQLVAFVRDCVVPLFILYNIVGWIGLPRREAARAAGMQDTAEKTYGKYDDTKLAALQRALRAAWFAGVLAAVIALWIVYVCFPNLANPCAAAASTDASQCPIGCVFTCMLLWAAVGLVLGIARGILPNLTWFRGKALDYQRRILFWLVFCVVAVSCCAAVLYYTSCPCLTDSIASFYACMLVGYAAALFYYEAAK